MNREISFFRSVVVSALFLFVSGCANGGNIASQRLPGLFYESKKQIKNHGGGQDYIENENGHKKVTVYGKKEDGSWGEIEVHRTDVLNDFIVAEFNAVKNPTDKGEITDYLSKGVLASDAACRDLMEKQFELYVGLNSGQSNFNIVANVAQAAMGLAEVEPKALGLAALGVGGVNSYMENQKAFSLYSNSFKVFFTKITEARVLVADKLKGEKAKIKHLDGARKILGEYHRTCSPMNLAVLFEKSLEKANIAPTEGVKLDLVTQAKLTVLSAEIYSLVEGGNGGAFSFEDLSDLYFVAFAADTFYAETLIENNPYVKILSAKLESLRGGDETKYEELIVRLNEVGKLLELGGQVREAREDTVEIAAADVDVKRSEFATETPHGIVSEYPSQVTEIEQESAGVFMDEEGHYYKEPVFTKKKAMKKKETAMAKPKPVDENAEEALDQAREKLERAKQKALNIKRRDDFSVQLQVY